MGSEFWNIQSTDPHIKHPDARNGSWLLWERNQRGTTGDPISLSKACLPLRPHLPKFQPYQKQHGSWGPVQENMSLQGTFSIQVCPQADQCRELGAPIACEIYHGSQVCLPTGDGHLRQLCSTFSRSLCSNSNSQDGRTLHSICLEVIILSLPGIPTRAEVRKRSTCPSGCQG